MYGMAILHSFCLIKNRWFRQSRSTLLCHFHQPNICCDSNSWLEPVLMISTIALFLLTTFEILGTYLSNPSVSKRGVMCTLPYSDTLNFYPVYKSDSITKISRFRSHQRIQLHRNTCRSFYLSRESLLLLTGNV